MSSIDQRIVDMQFKYQQFENGVKSVLSHLDNLSKKLKLDGASKGLDEVANSSRRINLGPLSSAADNVAHRFSVMSIIVGTAIATVAHQAVIAGERVVKSFTVGPLLDGLHEYETNLGAIQTVMANTGLEGKAGLAKVNDALNELNTYSDKTIYNFSEMAKNIGTFTAAGVDLKTSTAAIKGIANLAAVSGSTSDQASTAMYQLSQALASGTVKLQDWNSVVNAGMGGKVFQEALKETARAHGVAIDGIIKKQGSFRESLQKGWLTRDVLTETLSKFTGDLNTEQLKNLGYTADQIKGIMKLGKTAQLAATQVKTASQLMDTLKEAAGSGWTQTWQIILGDFGEAPKLFTGINNVLGGMISNSAKARNKVLQDWKNLGGRDTLIDGFKLAFDALETAIKPVRDAFRTIFPATTGKSLYELTEKFHVFTEYLKISDVAAQNVRRTFSGVFAIFDIAKQIVGAIGEQFVRLLHATGQGGGGILKFTAGIGMFLVSLDKALKKGKFFETFFGKVADIIAVPLHLIVSVADGIGNLFKKFDNGGGQKVTSTLDAIGNRFSAMQALAQRVKSIFSAVSNVIGNFASRIGGILVTVGQAIGNAIGNAFSSANYSKTLDTINTGLFAAIVLMVKRFTSGGVNVNVGEGLFGQIKSTLSGVTDTLKSMQQQIKAKTILEIAGALALLTASLLVLSLIDSASLTKAFIAIAAGFAILQGGLIILSKTIGVIGAAKLTLIAASLVAISGALLILALAMKIMATMSWEEIGKGLTGVAGSLTVIAAAMRLMPKGMVLQAAAIGILAGALLVLGTAMKLFASLNWKDMGKGLAGVAGSLIVVAAAMRLMPKGMVLQAAALTIIAQALLVLGGAVKIFSTFSWQDMGKGLAGVAGSLLVIAAAMTLMPKDMLLQSVALIAVGVALNVIATAVLLMSKMSWEEIGKGLTTLGGALLILAAGLYLMSGTLAGAAALLVAAGALAILTPVLVTLGALSWTSIIKGLSTLAGIFTILGLAGLILAPIVPVIIGLGAALVLIGAGMALAGAGALAFATAFAIMVAAGVAGVTVLAAILKTLVAAIPGIIAAIASGIVKFAQTIAKGGKAFFEAFTTILGAIIGAIVANVPKIVAAFFKIVTSILDSIVKNGPKVASEFLKILGLVLGVIVKAVPQIADAAYRLLVALINTIRDNAPKIIPAVTKLITTFLEQLGKNLPKIVDAGLKFVISFINGVANAIRANSGPLGEAGANLASAIVEGMGRGLAGAVKTFFNKGRELGKSILDGAKSFLGIHSPSKEFEKVGNYVNQGFAKGLEGNKADVLKSYKVMQDLLSAAMKNAADDVHTLETRLDKLNAAHKRDSGAIADTTAALKQSKSELSATSAAHAELTKNLDDERNKLATLGAQHEKLATKLKNANDVLAAAKKTRDDYNASTKEQYNTLPDISKDTNLTDYIGNLEVQVQDTKTFAVALQQLRDLGLNDSTYKELLGKGLDALPFVNDLLRGGKDAVTQINTLTSSLTTAAATMGATASKALYQAGVDSAAGIVKGLQSQQTAIEKQMETIADAMVKAVKKKLGIKSPSREFAKIGNWSVEGMISGLQQGSVYVQKAAQDIGDVALQTLQNSISGLSKAIETNVDINPVIAPVLDLSNMRAGSARIGSMLSGQSISVDAAYSKASYASSGYNSNKTAEVVVSEPVSTPQAPIVFQQYNSSPKALSEAEIYRQTNNLVSKARGALVTA